MGNFPFLNLNYDNKSRLEYLIKELWKIYLYAQILSFNSSAFIFSILRPFQCIIEEVGVGWFFCFFFAIYLLHFFPCQVNKTWMVQSLEEQKFHKTTDNRISVKTSARSMKASMEHGSRSVIKQMEFRKSWVSADC